MQILSKKRALDKIYKRRDRYEIPDWQREEVWNATKKQELIDSILRNWKLPKFYFLKVDDEPEEFEVVDGQQRLVAIFEFLDNTLPLSAQSAERFGAEYYRDLPQAVSDGFDDFEIEYDEISDADESEIKEFFQRLQQGLPLTSSEKLNAFHSNLRDFCRKLAGHNFFKTKVAFADKRYAYFDVIAKVAAVEIEGIDAGLRFDDLKATFESQKAFSQQSAVAQRLRSTLDWVDQVFPGRESQLRNRTVVQSILTLAARINASGRGMGHEQLFYKFINDFLAKLSKQVELGSEATDQDYLLFQNSINANVRSGARIRNEILLRKMLRADPAFSQMFDPTVVAESGLSKDIKRLSTSIADLITKANTAYAAKHGEDLFKPTNKTVQALTRLGKVVSNYAEYKDLVSDLYFIFWEAAGTRLGNLTPTSFVDVNAIRTDLEHDLDHGNAKAIVTKRKRTNLSFIKYAGASTPTTIAPELFPVFQGNLFSALEADLRGLLVKI
jgi:hypothetical protein